MHKGTIQVFVQDFFWGGGGGGGAGVQLFLIQNGYAELLMHSFFILSHTCSNLVICPARCILNASNSLTVSVSKRCD